MIKDNLDIIKRKIKEQKEKSPFKQEVNLVAVTKTRTIEEIKEVLDYGIYDLGENRVKELLEKQAILTDENIKWHLIGHLQTNKVKQIIGKTYLIHSVDSIRLLEEINNQSKNKDIITNVLLEINIGKEENKYGFSEDEILSSLENASKLKNINVKGLMCMAPFTNDDKIIKELFLKMHKIYEKCSIISNTYTNISMEVLSMGMSNDYEIGIICGSNTLRIGSNIFKGED